ncbi:out at first protein homolog isoform X2 [Megalobrama amblycephala]|uniref:out at first protein homolog isoform X2 n=1 Tax=Megalobrama amblycephala TaxID=75352 RepID=UPI002013CFCA|nr:out at first protein homolog isoform X2 [Megalobrama amblycephala]
MNARVTLPASVQIAFVVFTLVLSVSVCSQLTVLVRLNDGQITEELLEADSEKDIITVEFKQADGNLITFLSDFKRRVKIFRALVLGEPEKGQSQYQALCFISHLDHGELIPSEAMARLRQKNPHVVRSAEERHGVERFTMNAVLNMSRSWYLSTHIRNVCRDARDLVYTRQQDVKHWLDKGVEGSIFEVFPQSLNVTGLQSCSSTTDPWQPCTCTYRLNLEWFPCQLKYCRGQGPNPYKCGIKSCSKGYWFDFYIPYKQLCLWDDDT